MNDDDATTPSSAPESRRDLIVSVLLGMVAGAGGILLIMALVALFGLGAP